MENSGQINYMIFQYLKEKTLELATPEEVDSITAMIGENSNMSVIRQILFLTQSKLPQALHAEFEQRLAAAVQEEDMDTAMQNVFTRLNVSISPEELGIALQKAYGEINNVLYTNLVDSPLTDKNTIDSELAQVSALYSGLSSLNYQENNSQ